MKRLRSHMMDTCFQHVDQFYKYVSCTRLRPQAMGMIKKEQVEKNQSLPSEVTFVDKIMEIAS